MLGNCVKKFRVNVNNFKKFIGVLYFGQNKPPTICFSEYSLNSNSFATVSNPNKDNKYDIAVIGAGIVGLATARELKERLPHYSICVIDKESRVSFHQSERNSGVIHAGIYYEPGSIRAKLCVEGLYLMYKYCEENNIPHKRNGKLIIAVNKQEVQRLNDLFARGVENKVPGLEILEPRQFRQIEPFMEGLKAINSPWTGIVNYGDVARHIAKVFKNMGGKLFLNFKVIEITGCKEGDGTTCGDASTYPITIFSEDKRSVRAGFLLTCAGLQSDRIAQMTGESPYPKIMPFRGEYFLLTSEKNCMVNGNVYPVPDPTTPFLGVHYTPKIDGSVWLGPTAMLAFKKEGYKWTDFDFKDFIDIATYRGVHKFFYKYFNSCIYEVLRSASSKVILKELQMYMPSLRLKDISPGVAVGIQAQAMNADGTFVEGFGFVEGKDKSKIDRVLHVRNAPSPAATASLAIGKYLADIVQERL